jgi:hypothetical protein
MVSAAIYNRQAWGKIWNLQDLPQAYPGYRILLRGDGDHDLPLTPEELDQIDWQAFAETVAAFQTQAHLTPPDGKLGPITLRRLRAFYGVVPERPSVLKQLGDLLFGPASVPVSAPPGPPLVGRTLIERNVANLWNHYGAAIYRQAQVCRVPAATALAVFLVESNMAYDPKTGLVIIRFEPHIFQRKSGVSVPYRRGGQQDEWQNLARAYDLHAEAALLSTSYGLPQLMGFNWPVTRHPGVRDLVLAFQDSCEEQVAGFFAFVEHNGLVRFILNGDWRGFARRYNGPGNVEDYAGRLRRALEAVNRLQEEGARFAV